jgi:hypothetical protein
VNFRNWVIVYFGQLKNLCTEVTGIFGLHMYIHTFFYGYVYALILTKNGFGSFLGYFSPAHLVILLLLFSFEGKG